MGLLLQRNQELAKRCGDLTPIAPAVRDVLLLGNKETVLADLTPDGRPVAPLRPATLARRKGTGPPRAPQGAAARIVSGCVVSVNAGPSRLSFTKSWPSLGEVAAYLNDGTSKMVSRPFMGYRPADLAAVRELLRQHVIKPGILGRIAGFFGR